MEKKENLKVGILWLLFSAFGFAVMGLCVREAGDIPFIEKTLFRNLIAFIIAFSGLCIKGKKDKSVFHVQKPAWKFLILRSLIGSLGIFGNFYALGYMNISDAAMLNKMSPFFAILMSIFILNEKPDKFGTIAIFVVFFGALFVIKPTFNFVKFFPALFGFIGGAGAGCASSFVRKLHTYDVNGNFIIAFFSLFSSLLALPFIAFCYTPLSLNQTLILLGAGIAAACGQFGMTNAYFNAPAAKISIYDYSNVIFAGLLGFIFLGQIPDIFSLIGYIIIIGTAIVVFIHNSKKKN